MVFRDKHTNMKSGDIVTIAPEQRDRIGSFMGPYEILDRRATIERCESFELCQEVEVSVAKPGRLAPKVFTTAYTSALKKCNLKTARFEDEFKGFLGIPLVGMKQTSDETGQDEPVSVL